MEFYIEQIKRDLKGLAEILEDDRRFEAEEEKPEWQKELNADTIMNDCDAINCKFWNEGFKGNCTLISIEINPQSGCTQFNAKESVRQEEDDYMSEIEDEEADAIRLDMEKRLCKKR